MFGLERNGAIIILTGYFTCSSVVYADDTAEPLLFNSVGGAIMWSDNRKPKKLVLNGIGRVGLRLDN